MRPRRIYVLCIVLGLLACAGMLQRKLKGPLVKMAGTTIGEKSVVERVTEFGDSVHGRLAGRFREIGVSYPPGKMLLVGLKQERELEVWVADGVGRFRYLKTYPVLGASGTSGPKLREGDRQVPEGVYRIESLNPNSRFHLALRVNYPNEFDKAKGRQDGRAQLGSDIMIHGGSASVGCLAIGDQAAEDLFVLAAETGVKNIELVLTPVDFRVRELPTDLPALPGWTAELYQRIKKVLLPLKRPN